jgi:hypothetical protein
MKQKRQQRKQQPTPTTIEYITPEKHRTSDLLPRAQEAIRRADQTIREMDELIELVIENRDSLDRAESEGWPPLPAAVVEERIERNRRFLEQFKAEEEGKHYIPPTERDEAGDLHSDEASPSAHAERIIECGWFYVTESGRRVEYISTDPVKDERNAKSRVTATLLKDSLKQHYGEEVDEIEGSDKIKPLVRREVKTILSD